MYPPRHALHFPTAFKWQLPGAENYVSLRTSIISFPVEVRFDQSISYIPYPPRHTHTHTHTQSITLTNYTDLERELVKDMIRITGIPYTGFLCRETTHLVSKRAVGKKYNKALEWGVQVVNASFLTDIIHSQSVYWSVASVEPAIKPNLSSFLPSPLSSLSSPNFLPSFLLPSLLPSSPSL